ncbi:MAG: methylated-DNA--[protein]-cysteine S-methyltransferase [Candidatus Rokubacteria bacterium]|nr:methylated-DNA--[protein]-cysteine S-methyltransferase [Candidatus Rokubacteria bacterium]
MDQLDDLLAEYFAPGVAPAGLRARLARVRPSRDLAAEVARFHIEASDTGVRRLTYGAGGDDATRAGRRHVPRARAELAEYLAGSRTFFSVPLDLTGIGDFQSKVLAEAARIPYGATTSYAELARRIGHAKASRAVGNALGANPIPILVPCHRIIRGDGTWGHYAFGALMKTKLLTLERSTPLLVGCSTTRIVCRRGCGHEQRMTETRRVVFASIPDARSVGYRPCKACHPR